jgi:hypothetical protein
LGGNIAVSLGSRGHLRLKSQTCDFVPIKIDFATGDVAGTVFKGHMTLKAYEPRNQRWTEFLWTTPQFYSVRRARIGETAAARLAGMMAATNAHPASDTAATTRATGSEADTP